MTLDKESVALMDALRERNGPKMHLDTPADLRAALKARRPALDTLPEVGSVEDRLLTLADGDEIVLRVITPVNPRPGVILYVHGGGWVLGEVGDFEELGRRFANATGRTVVMCDYRTAPENPFPGPLNDAWETLQYLRDQQGVSLPEGPLVVSGDSAGGNIATVLAARAARAGLDLGAQILMYPITDYDLDTPSYVAPENQLTFYRLGAARCWELYIPDPALRTHPEASPLRAEVPDAFAPAIVVSAEYDVLLDEGDLYIEHLRKAGVPVLHRHFLGQLHGFLGSSALPVSEDGIQFMASALDELLGDPATV